MLYQETFQQRLHAQKRNIFYLQAGNKDFVREVRLLPNRNESLRPDKSIKMRSAIFMKRRNAFAGSK